MQRYYARNPEAARRLLTGDDDEQLKSRTPSLEADAVNPLTKQFYAEALAVSFADAAIFMTKYCSANVYRAFISP